MSTLESERDDLSVELDASDTPRTTVVARPDGQEPATKRRITRVRLTDLLQLVGGALGAVALGGVGLRRRKG